MAPNFFFPIWPLEVRLSSFISTHLAMGRFFLVKSTRWMAKGMEHTASTFTTLKAENLT